jgi:hypothetical protein
VPEPEDYARGPGQRPAHRCDRGWVQVTAAYIDKQYPRPDPPDTDDLEVLDLYDKQCVDIDLRRKAAANTVYPCRVCRPADFFRWLNGHTASDHDKDTCTECSGITRRAGRR